MATDIYRTKAGGFVVWFAGKGIQTTLTSSGDVVDSWLDETYRIHHRRGLVNRLVVGIDVEWRPCSASTRRAVPPPVALLQICVGRRCLVFKILHAVYVPESLSDFLADERFAFVGVGVRDDAANLRADYGLKVRRTVDLRTLAAKAKRVVIAAGTHPH